ncbi:MULTISPECIES: cysteine synthase A [Anaerotruncus]|jgi:cysteine synthase A|uniref:Cysteine synthase n=1 Tax=Anaerotruncus colihominis TaxID=169435 RepID=A0A845RG46_9FIRM|nr:MULTISPECIES: cysteine synthase A [Anaerotruncus]MCI8493546.1 cysteine synthase A [Anaerotruncus sp.]MCR2024969.1 cysteine synthase A [Anaerotruncus colihominis]NBI77948.1 cysteine synthase A [Anaerotruncus colihominis]NDO40186.1 cysteine synthase A [Anaerotruncus colihominis]
MNIKDNLTQLIGDTPLMYLSGEQSARVAVKLEYFNPLGSVKDRAAFAMIADAEKRGALSPGALVVEPTSGNTGIGLAFVCAARGYRLVLTMPETMSTERRMLLAALGAELILTSGAEGMAGAVKKAEEIAAAHPGAFMPRQFENPANPAIHEAVTAREILRDTDGRVDLFVASFGTGGTISGVGRALKAANPAIRIIGVEPAESPLVTEGYAGKHGIQGIGANFVPKNLDRCVIDEIVTVATQDAIEASRRAAKDSGLLVGVSSGAAIAAARRLAQRPENAGKLIVALCPDGGERYLSTGLYETKEDNA